MSPLPLTEYAQALFDVFNPGIRFDESDRAHYEKAARALLRLAWSVEPTEEMVCAAIDSDAIGDCYDDIFKAMQSALLRGVIGEESEMEKCELGIVPMMHMICGSERPAYEYYGQKITAAEIADDKLTLSLSGGKVIDIWDDGQSCCESRYMRTDDDVNSLVGQTLTRIEAKNAPDEHDENGECHEVVFLEIRTDQGCITIANHNEHNGYYGGFALNIRESNPCPQA